MPRLAYVVHANWKLDPGGPSTFVRLVESAWRKRFDLKLIEKPGLTLDMLAEGRRSAKRMAQSAERAADGTRLALGYVRDLWRDIRWVWSVRKRLKGRTIVTNDFGCETLPIALRLVNPCERIVSIAHTHPGQDSMARKAVRKTVERLCYRSVDDIVFNSHELHRQWAGKLGMSGIKGAVIHHGLSQTDPTVPHDYPAKPEGTVDFVYLAQFHPWKGQINALKAWKLVRQGLTRDGAGSSIRLIFVGDGENLEAAVAFAEAEKLTGSVVFMGRCQEGSRYLNGADVVVLLPVEPEAFGFVLVEAMSRSKPVIASSMGGIGEIVEDGRTGLLVDPLSPEKIAEGIVTLARDSESRARMGQEGFERWKRHFALERMLKDYDSRLRSSDGNAGVTI